MNDRGRLSVSSSEMSRKDAGLGVRRLDDGAGDDARDRTECGEVGREPEEWIEAGDIFFRMAV